MSADVESQQRQTNMLTYKIVFLGERSVGKTSIVSRYMFGQFEPKYQNVQLRLQLWDTAGQERFRSLIPSYIHDSSAAVVVYDVTDSNSFIQSSRWVDDVRAQRGKDVLVMLVGNKTDESSKRQITKETGQAKAEELNAMFLETSAKDGYNIDQLFHNLIAKLPIVIAEVSRHMSMTVSVVPLESNAKEDKKRTCSC